MKLIKKFFKYSFLLAVLVFLVGFSYFAYTKLSHKLEITSANNISMFDNKGELFFRGNGNSEWVGLDEISDNLINATIATEDKNFYGHLGFDVLRIMKALYLNTTSGKTIQGASTISQQYAKTLYLDFDKTWSRKWDEMWLTMNLELYYSKEEILEGYLNTINYGHGLYGIESATKFYFDKSSKDLTLAEASLLAGIPKSPSNYSPLVNFDLAKTRQALILNSMVKNKYITNDEKNSAFEEEFEFYGKKDNINLSTIMYYQDAVIRELEGIDTIPTSLLETGGLRIYTNLDIDAQTALEEKIADNLKNKEDLQSAAIMMNPNNGGIIALIGGRDYSVSQFNRATQSSRQVGSAMKPFLYYAALENGFTSSTSFTSEETTFTFSNNQSYSPRNANEVYGNKPISLAAAIAYSDNIYAVKTHIFLGEEALVNISSRLGISSNMQPIPSLALGTSEINIIDMARAYSAFANFGYKVNPHLINKIEDANGNVLYEVNDTKELVLNSSLVYILNNLLTSTYDSSFIDFNYPTILNIANKISRKYSVKSGTTATDSWTIGYNPEIVTAVWIGYDEGKNINVSDYNYTKNIFADATESFLKGKEDKWYSMPSNVVGVLVDPINGKPVNESSSKKKILYYLKGSEPTGSEPVFDEIDKEK